MEGFSTNLQNKISRERRIWDLGMMEGDGGKDSDFLKEKGPNFLRQQGRTSEERSNVMNGHAQNFLIDVQCFTLYQHYIFVL
jgi:hypothetical protein